jgi:hypothetical protein
VILPQRFSDESFTDKRISGSEQTGYPWQA